MLDLAVILTEIIQCTSHSYLLYQLLCIHLPVAASTLVGIGHRDLGGVECGCKFET
jgi:hypothetical protein